MWPQALQMTRDECRGILRRLELESYSHVISVFRAQGGLSENKAKLLEELRSIFHISQERHRAEARRVANDEQLSTIAEAISGPNTWQEWSREGRRSFPMLPRVAPQTALALIANSVAADTASENMKLPYPSDTAALVASEQAAHAEAKSAYEGEKLSWNIISSDPFKVPDIPVIPKKTLKRNMPDSHASSNKRRILNETSPTKMQYQQQKLKQQQYGVEGGGAVVTPTSNIRKLYHNHSKMQQQQKINQQQQQQQQLSQKQQQQLQKQKQPGKKGGAQTKRQTAAKGKKAAQLLKEQQQQQQQQQKLHQQPQQQQQIHQQSTLLPESQHHHQQQQQPQYISISGSNTNEVMMQIETSDDYKESAIATHIMPQIAASKKDISKNLTKLHIPPSTQQTIIGTAASGQQQQSTAARIIPLDSTSTAVIAGASSSTLSSMNTTTTNTTPPIILAPKTDKQLISTPVQKYIVEDRQSPAATSPQIMTLPQLSAAANKLRTMNTTILPPGTKLTTKKLPTIAGGTTGTEQSSSHPQVFNIIEGTTITSTTNMAAPLHPATPTHTPPAVIQLNNLNSSASGSNTVVEQTLPTTPQPSPAQGKVLTTKLLPIVLSGSSHNKLETLNNEATLVGSGSNAAVSGTALFKTLPTSMLVSAGGSGNTFTTGTHTVFRKPPNIIKTGIIGMGAGNVINTSGTGTSKISSAFGGNSGPQIISNIKLTSGVVTSAGGGGTSTSTQFLKTVSSTGMRANVKICQSPNGKMFIQPANADTLKTAKLQTSLQQKLLPTQLSTTSGGSSIVTQPTQRIAIQKVQIIPAPMSSPGSLSTTLQQHKPTTSLSISNKANMIFMPTTCGARGGAATISLSKGNNNSNILSKTQQQQQPIDVTKQNVFVIGSVAQQQSSQGLKSSTSRGELANQMITEDTPVDILNMPIIVDNSNTVSSSGSISTTGSNIGDTVTVLSNEIIATATNLNQQEQQIQSNQQSSAVVLGVTDWEMELDQATAVAAATKAAARTQRRAVGGSSAATMKANKSVEKVQRKQQNTTIVVDDNYDDVIVEETFIDDDDGIDEEELHENSSDIGGVVTIEEKNHSAQLVQQIHPPNPQYSSEEMNIIEVVDDEQNSQQKDVTLDDTESGGILKEKLLASPVISKANDENIDTYDNAVEIDENTAIEYIEEDNNEGSEDRTSNFLSLKTDDENNKTTVPVEGNNTDQANSDTNAKNDQTVSTTIDGNNISTKNIVVDTESTIKSSENALADVETQSPTHKDNSSQDGQ